MICHVISFDKTTGVGQAIKSADLRDPVRSSCYTFVSQKTLEPKTCYSFKTRHGFAGNESIPFQLELDYGVHGRN